MVGAPLPVPPAFPAPSVPAVPFPRRPLAPGGARECLRWYECVLGWPTTPGPPVRLRTGVRFDVLEVPAEAGHAALDRFGSAAHGPGFPVAVHGERMLLLVAAGSAEEMPGLLEWLDWGSLPLGLTAVGAGGVIDAPLPVGSASTGPPPRPPGRDGLRGAAVWLRPPEPGCEVEASLPTLSAMGGTGTAPDLARLVHTLATQCHRIRLAPSSRFARPSRATR